MDTTRKYQSRNSQYWFPVLIPLLIGLLLPLLQLGSNFQQTETTTGIAEQLVEWLEESGEELSLEDRDEMQSTISEQKAKVFWEVMTNFYSEVVKSIVVALISVDVWALSVLFTIKVHTKNSNMAYAPAVIVLFFHMCLTIGSTSIPGSVSIKPYIESGILMVSFFTALWVREAIWRAVDGVPEPNVEIEESHNKSSNAGAVNSAGS